MRLFSTLVLLCLWSTGAVAQETPDSGILNDQVYVPALSGVCGLGANRDDGCDSIRTREILDASDPPWSAVGRVNFASVNIRGHCTGALVSDRWVLTAAHCFYNQRRKAWMPAESYTFVAGLDRGTPVATARGVRYVLDPVQAPETRDFRGDFANDWALLELDAPIGEVAGTFDLFEGGDTPEAILMPGYAGLRPQVLTLARDCEPWFINPLQRLAIGACSAMPGDSGAPLLFETADGRLVIAGVHSGSVTDQAGALFSAAVPVDNFRSAVPTD